ncbi:MAG: hypothetical protein FWF59_07415 [Turicibacter sp.]|nr:hypothetical protein [Turicibacter sp.]
MKKTESNMLFLNGFFAGIILAMVSFIEIYRSRPGERIFLTVLIWMTGLVLGVVFQFCYMELRATSSLRWAFEMSEGKIPENILRLHDFKVEPSLEFLMRMNQKLFRHSIILLFLNGLKLMTTLLVGLTLWRSGSQLLVFGLVWMLISHFWVYALSAKSLQNGRFARAEIFGILELYRFRLKKRF